MSLRMIDHEDFSVVVKNRASPPKPWRWEIYRAGRTSPIQSNVFFESVAAANCAGKAALRSLLSDYPTDGTSTDVFDKFGSIYRTKYKLLGKSPKYGRS